MVRGILEGPVVWARRRVGALPFVFAASWVLAAALMPLAQSGESFGSVRRTHQPMAATASKQLAARRCKLFAENERRLGHAAQKEPTVLSACHARTSAEAREGNLK